MIEREQPMTTDYFAERLLGQLDAADPVFATYEAQAISRDVGFDFADFQGVVPRALDEVRETREAFDEEGPEGREHFGDEIADNMFSHINLVRHAGVEPDELPTIEELESTRGVDANAETLGLLTGIEGRIKAVSEQWDSLDAESSQLVAKELYADGMVDAITLARVNGFNPTALLRENVRKYLVRCQAIESLAAEDGKQWADLATNDEIITYWKAAKKLLG
jgi:uncharacterized protein YabN with tetrapyrrole methylase and pyrophosphatase domain